MFTMHSRAKIWVRSGLFAAVAAVSALISQTASADSPPNIVLIISDDHLWSDYSFMGHPHIKTPNIDALASQSLTFTHGYVPSSLCCPSLASIVTGLYPHQHLITSNDPPIPKGMKSSEFMKSDAFRDGREVMKRHMEVARTLPRLLAEKGYVSLQTGKWWEGSFQTAGFTSGMTQGGRHGDVGLEIGRKTMQPVKDFISDAAKSKTPFFVWYAPFMPHTPHTPPDRLLDKYKTVAPTLAVARYWAMVEWLDETVGELLTHLDEKGVRDNTIVVYLADNGWITNPETGYYSPRSKQSQYEGGLRTPIIVHWPGHIRPQKSEDLAISIDIAPTLLLAVGASPTAEMQGIDLLNTSAREKRKSIHGECFTHNAVDLNDPAANLRWRWTIDGSWKLIVPSKRNEPNSEIELYDLARDPQEEHNLANEQSDRVNAMQAKLNSWWSGRPVRAAAAGKRAVPDGGGL